MAPPNWNISDKEGDSSCFAHYSLSD